MPKIERYICVRFEGHTHEVHNCYGSDGKASLEAIHEVERRLGMMRGGLMKHFKENPDEIWGVMK